MKLKENILKDVFFEISKALSSTLDLNKVVNLTIDFLENLVPFYSCCFILRDELTKKFVIIESRYMNDKKLSNITQHLIPFILKEFKLKKLPLIIHDVEKFRVEKGVKTIFVLPIIFEEEIIGFIYFDNEKKEAFSELPLNTFLTLSAEVAISIKNAQLYKNLNQKVDELAALYEASKELSSTLQLDEIKKLIINFTENILKPQFAYLMLTDKMGNLTIATAKGINIFPEKMKGYTLSNEVALNKKPYITSNLRSDKLYNKFEFKDTIDCKSLISIPLIAHDKIIGVFTIGSSKENYFNQDNVRVFSILCSLYAAAIENAILYKEKEELSITNGLTGIFNHRYFQDRLTQEIKRTDRYNTLLSLAIIDIDNFKIVNDTYGHSYGDIVLKNVAHLLKNNFRETDFVARYGGEEFTVILPHTPLYGGYTACERVRKLIAEYNFAVKHKKRYNLTISAGVACYPLNADSKEMLISRADTALYKAKQLGKNKVCIFE